MLPTTAAGMRLHKAILDDYVQHVAFDILGRDAKDIKVVIQIAKRRGLSREKIFQDIFKAGMDEMTHRGFVEIKQSLRGYQAINEYAI